MKNNNLSLVIYEQHNLALTTNAHTSDKKNSSNSSNGNLLTISSTRLFTKIPRLLKNSSNSSILDDENSLGNGRPKMISKVLDETSHKTNYDTTHEIEDIVQSSKEIVEESKRKRGRPRKNTTIGDTSNDLVKEVPKRKPGRPRKTTPIVDPSNDLVEEVPKRKRGRPRKSTTVSLSGNLLSSNATDISNISDDACFKNLQLLIQTLEKQKEVDVSSNKYLVPNLTIQQKFLIVILKKLLADANTVKGRRAIKELWSYISSTLDKEVIIGNDESEKDETSSHIEEKDDTLSSHIEGNPVSNREIVLTKVGNVFTFLPPTTMELQCIELRKDFIMTDSNGEVIKEYNMTTKFILLDRNGQEIKPSEVIGTEMVLYTPSYTKEITLFTLFIFTVNGNEIEARCFNATTLFILLTPNGLVIRPWEVAGLDLERLPSINYDYEARQFETGKAPFNWMHFTTGIGHPYIDKDIVMDELLEFFTYYKHNYQNNLYFEILIKFSFTSGEFRTLFKAQRSSYLEHDYEKLCRYRLTPPISLLGLPSRPVFSSTTPSDW